MMRMFALATFALSGCAADLDIGSGASGLGGIDVYEKQFEWTEPEVCQTFLHRRVYDEAARVVSYEASAAGQELTATYEVDESNALPLAIEIAGDAGPLMSLRSSATDLEVRGASGELALRVTRYVDGPGEVVDRAPYAVEAETLALLACTLPMRTELGYVPGFVRNVRDAVGPNADGVAGSTSDAAQLVPWEGATTLLGAWVRQGMCLRVTDGAVDWHCGCFEVRAPVVGVVRGDCP